MVSSRIGKPALRKEYPVFLRSLTIFCDHWTVVSGHFDLRKGKNVVRMRHSNRRKSASLLLFLYFARLIQTNPGCGKDLTDTPLTGKTQPPLCVRVPSVTFLFFYCPRPPGQPLLKKRLRGRWHLTPLHTIQQTSSLLFAAWVERSGYALVVVGHGPLSTDLLAVGTALAHPPPYGSCKLWCGSVSCRNDRRIRRPAPPLLEEEVCTCTGTSVSHMADPVRVHRTCPTTRLSAHDHPHHTTHPRVVEGHALGTRRGLVGVGDEDTCVAQLVLVADAQRGRHVHGAE